MTVEGCPLCRERCIRETPLSRVLEDKYPVFPGHRLVVPKRHVGHLRDLSELEVMDLWRTASAEANAAGNANVGLNDGPASGQTIPHVHVHVIPRRVGDVEDPRGGVRNVNPGTARYWEDDTEIRAELAATQERYAEAERGRLFWISKSSVPTELAELVDGVRAALPDWALVDGPDERPLPAAISVVMEELDRLDRTLSVFAHRATGKLSKSTYEADTYISVYEEAVQKREEEARTEGFQDGYQACAHDYGISVEKVPTE